MAKKKSVRKPRPRRESQAETRGRLLVAAAETFARYGYEGASVDRIAAAAGFSKGAVYANFDSKEGIFLELLAQHMADKMAALDGIVQAELGPDATIASLDAWLRRMNQDAAWGLLAVVLQLHARRERGFGEQADRLFEAHRARLATLISRLFAAAGKKPLGDPLELARGFIALTDGLTIQSGLAEASDSPAGRLMADWVRLLIAAAPPVDVR